jgi:hypothetical protein
MILFLMLQGKDTGGAEELAGEEYSGDRCHRRRAHLRPRRSWLPGQSSTSPISLTEFFGLLLIADGNHVLQGMGIPVGKLALYTALGGVRPSAVSS